MQSLYREKPLSLKDQMEVRYILNLLYMCWFKQEINIFRINFAFIHKRTPCNAGLLMMLGEY